MIPISTFLVLLQVPGNMPTAIVSGSVVTPVGYCSSPGYPAAPATGSTFWFKADSFSPCSGTSESSWTDSSGNSHTATLSGGTFTCNANQLNNHNGLAVSGNATASLAGTITGNNHNNFYAVIQTPASISNGTSYALVGSTSNTNNEVRFNGSATSVAHQQIVSQGNTVNLTGNLTMIPSTWYQMTYNTPNDSLSTMNLNLGFDNSAATFFNNGPSNLLFDTSGTEYFSGTIAEMIFYSSTLSAANSLTTECYLYGKYMGQTPVSSVTSVNSAVADQGSSSTSSLTTGSFTSSTGNLLVALVRNNSGTGGVSSVTDLAGNTWHHATAAKISAGSNTTDIWYAYNAIGQAGDTVTVNFSQTAAFNAVIVKQFSGVLASSDPLDTTGTGSANSTVAASSTYTPGAINELTVAVASQTVGSSTWTLGGVLGHAVNSGGGADIEAGDGIVLWSGATNVWLKYGSSSNMLISVAVFKHQ